MCADSECVQIISKIRDLSVSGIKRASTSAATRAQDPLTFRESKAGVDHEADYRALTKDGGYVRLRDVVHVVRKPVGSVDSLVGFMFDISERKKTEEKLAALQRELEALMTLAKPQHWRASWGESG
jgi:hypothetical protein